MAWAEAEDAILQGVNLWRSRTFQCHSHGPCPASRHFRSSKKEYLNQLQEEYKLINENNAHYFNKAVMTAFKRGEAEVAQTQLQGDESEAATTGQFDLRNKVGQKWQQHLKNNVMEAEAYTLRTMPEKREKRAAWAKEHL